MIYAIGDIHGCLDPTQRLLDRIAADADELGIARPRLVLLGDYIDRGPDSRRVLDLLSGGEIEQRFAPVYLLGNHDAAMLHVVREVGAGVIDREYVRTWLANGGAETVESFGVKIGGRGQEEFLRELAGMVPSDHLSFLAGLRLSYREIGWFFSHAGVDPAKPLDAQNSASLVYGDNRLFDHDHPDLALKLRDQLGCRLVHGHRPVNAVDIRPHRINVDTGCGWLGSARLSAVAIDGDGVRVLSPYS